MRHETWADRIYAWMLVFYPRRFRRQYGLDMVEMFRDARIDRARTGRSTFTLWVKTIRDLVLNASIMRVAPLTKRLRGVGRNRHSRVGNRSLFDARIMMEAMLLDIRYALRTLWKAKGFTAIAVLTIAMAIAANSSIFSVINAVLLRPLPYPDADRLVVLWTQFPAGGNATFPASQAEYWDYREESEAFQNMGAFSVGTATVTGDGNPERIAAASASATLFDVLGLRPQLGRVYTVAEDFPGQDLVTVLSHGFWQRRFAGDPTVVGRMIMLQGVSYEIVGVMEDGADPPGAKTDVWLPLAFDRSQITNRSGHWLTVIGRLADGETFESAFAELETTVVRWSGVYAGLHTSDPVNHPLTLVELDDELLGGVRPAMAVLAGAVGLVLLLACANVANLLLARGQGRSREIGVRAALGAGRARISRQLLTESLVIALLGGGLGLAAGSWGTALLIHMDLTGIPRILDVGLDVPVVVFTAVLTLMTGVVFGWLPALNASRVDLAAVLSEGGRGDSHGRETRRTLNWLVVSQMALAVVLLIGSGLLIKSFAFLQRVDPGFDAAGRVAFDLNLPGRDYRDLDDMMAFYDGVMGGVEALPGVSSVALVRNLPLRTSSRQEGVLLERKTNSVNEGAYPVEYQAVSADYFTTMAIPVVRGRGFAEMDRRGVPTVAVINETMARSYWSEDEDPVGWRLRPLFAGRDADWVTVVGVVGDVRHGGLSAVTKPELYLSMRQALGGIGWMRSASVVVRAGVHPEALSAGIRNIVRAADENVPVVNFQSLDGVVTDTLTQQRFIMLLLALFGGGALAIAAVGVYGVISFSVARRTHEIGIRMALGANQGDVLRQVVNGGVRMAGLGAAIGVGLALASSRVLESQLYGVSVRDFYVFSAGAGVLLVISVVASLVPALRASRVDPNLSLRSE